MYVWIIFQMKIRLARRIYDIMEKTELLITNILKSCKNIIILLNLEQLKGGHLIYIKCQRFGSQFIRFNFFML